MDYSCWATPGDASSGLASPHIRMPNGSLCKLVKPAAGTPRRLICFVIGTASTARHIPVGFERWAFATDRLRHDRRGKTVMPERLIGSIRRECLDHVIVFGE